MGACLVKGLAQGGVAAVAKHFPGHGYATADSHVAVPTDDRDFRQIEKKDILPYKAVIEAGVAGVMPAHVIYPKVDPRPAGFSPFWLKEILRRKLRFDGIVFSDDLSMEGASVAGDIIERGQAALAAGCDMVLVCNARAAALKLLDGLGPASLDATLAPRMRGPQVAQQLNLPDYEAATTAIAQARAAGTLA